MASNTCCTGGPGYATPADAIKATPETIVYLPCIPVDPETKPNYLATVDVDPKSPTYSKVLNRAYVDNPEDELHHSGWNACSSCHTDSSRKRNYLVLPSINSAKVFIFDVGKDPLKPSLHKIVGPEEIINATKTSYLHTCHCLADGNIMISGMGDEDGNPKGSFILIDGKSFAVTGTWQASGDEAPFGYDFWYQPRHNVMVSSEWGAPKSFLKGFDPSHVAAGEYGTSLNVWDWTTRKHLKRIDLGADGMIPLELRFLHEPSSNVGFVCCALSSTVFRFFQDEKKEWQAEKVISVPAQKVTGWALPNMPALITDIVISMDDKYLFISNWLQGDIRQYDISNTREPKLVGQVYIGGSLLKDGDVKIAEGDFKLKDPLILKGARVQGGPQMIQLSLDGKRLYVTTSLFSAWDKQFYPGMGKHGSFLLQIDVDNSNKENSLKVNMNFGVDFGAEPGGAALAHEVRYPGGDCTSDIWL